MCGVWGEWWTYGLAVAGFLLVVFVMVFFFSDDIGDIGN